MTGARKIATCAVMVTLLVAVQFALSFVPGVELVTVLLLCFCFVFGAGCGMLVATAFSLIRCILFGFAPNVVILYLVYYNLFALLFGSLRGRRLPVWVSPALLALLAAGSASLAIIGLPVSVIYKARIRVMLWVLTGLSAALFIANIILVFRRKRNAELACFTALAAICTVMFTLLDDAITPLVLGYGAEAALAYFYAGFLVMVPQTICAAISVFALFTPLSRSLTAINGGHGGRPPLG